MRKIHSFNILMVMALMTVCMLASCGSSNNKGDEQGDGSAEWQPGDEIPMIKVTEGKKTYNVADVDDAMAIYKESVNRDNCFIVISKREYRLYVYEVAGKDTVLAAHFPVCYARNAEAKTKSGDMCTPESSMKEPFFVKQIQEASDWCHDFGDGRGSIKSYGDWFIRLETPGFTGVGIHGSTNNVVSVPGRDSEGCIRLRDADLVKLHDLYIKEGQKIIIKSIKDGKMPFEKNAEEALGDKYKTQVLGNTAAKNAGKPDSESIETSAVSSETANDVDYESDEELKKHLVGNTKGATGTASEAKSTKASTKKSKK